MKSEIVFNLVIFYFNFLLPDQEDRANAQKEEQLLDGVTQQDDGATLFEGGLPGELQSRALVSNRTYEYLRTTPTMMSGWAARQENNRISYKVPIEEKKASPKPSPNSARKKVVPSAQGFASKLNTFHHTNMQSDGNSISIPNGAPSISRKGPVLDDTLTEDEESENNTFKNRLQEEKMSIMMQLLDEEPKLKKSVKLIQPNENYQIRVSNSHQNLLYAAAMQNQQLKGSEPESSQLAGTIGGPMLSPVSLAPPNRLDTQGESGGRESIYQMNTFKSGIKTDSKVGRQLSSKQYQSEENGTGSSRFSQQQ